MSILTSKYIISIYRAFIIIIINGFNIVIIIIILLLMLWGFVSFQLSFDCVSRERGQMTPTYTVICYIKYILIKPGD